MKLLKEQHKNALASIKQQHDTKIKKIRDDSKGGNRQMGIIEKHVLMKSLKENILDVTFKKMDGTIRMMKCTLRQDYLPLGETEEEKTAARDYTNMDIDTMYHFCGDKTERWAAAMTVGNPDFSKISLHTWLCQWLPHVIESSVAARKNLDKSHIIRVWELNSGWRSFYLDRVTSVQLANP